MSEITIKVTPEELSACADDVKSLASALQTDLDSLQELAGRSAYYWEGAAGDQYRSDFASHKESCDEILVRIDRFRQDLLDMAGIYEQAESTNTGNIAALDTDYIA